MRPNLTIATAVVAAFTAGASASHAQDKSLDPGAIVSFMQEEVANLGAQRGICITSGLDNRCPVRPPRKLDMLVTFDLDSADLTAEARENLAVFAEALNDDRLAQADFVVEGHTDARGSEHYNEQLSQRRAEAVKAYLSQLGVSDDRLQAIGMGERQPRTSDNLDPQNRRVELRVAVPGQ